MEQQIYEPKWRYDYWADIENIYPIGHIIICKATSINSIKQNYAFLKTMDGIDCFLGRDKISSPWRFSNLSEVLSLDIEYECTVIDYDFEKKGLVIALNLNP